jgi:hypothetical protein
MVKRGRRGGDRSAASAVDCWLGREITPRLKEGTKERDDLRCDRMLSVQQSVR